MTANAALGAHLQPFAGIPTFMRQPATRDLAQADVCVMGVPIDSGVSHRPAAASGRAKFANSHSCCGATTMCSAWHRWITCAWWTMGM